MPPSGSQPLSPGSGTSSLRWAPFPCLDRRYAPPGAALAAEVDACPLIFMRARRCCSQPSSLLEEALLRGLLEELLATYPTSSCMPDGSELSNKSERWRCDRRLPPAAVRGCPLSEYSACAFKLSECSGAQVLHASSFYL